MVKRAASERVLRAASALRVAVGRPGATDQLCDLGTRRDAELLEDVPHVGLDGLQAQKELLRDLAVCAATVNELGHLELASGQQLHSETFGLAAPRPAMDGLPETAKLRLGLVAIP
jgi:hypothetical protein